MGWLTPEQQQEVRRIHRMVALYSCDLCGKPISILEMPVINPRKGYFKWNKERSPKECRSFHMREPKVTYHQGYCNDERLGRKHKTKKEKEMAKTKKKDKKDKKKASAKKTVKSNPKVEKAVLSLITKKENHYDKARLIAKLKDKYEKAEIRDAITTLWSAKKIRKDTGKLKYYLYEAKKGKSKKEDASDEEE